MKRIVFIVSLCTVIFHLMGTPVGKINFFLGEVQMKDNQNLAYKTATMNAVVHQEGYVKTGPDASLEIKWTNGCVSKVESNKLLSISKLLEEANANPNWRNKLATKASSLKLQSKQSAKSVAGIRRDEVEVKKESSLFWYTETPLIIDDAIEYYDNKDYTSAIPIFEGVIEQGPLKRDAELAHSYLILIYDALGDRTKMKQHVEILKTDFPESSTLDSLPPDK